MLKAAIIIPHYNDTERLRRCLEALAPQFGDQVEAIVVDNGSTEDVNAVINAFSNVAFVVEDEKGAAAARNRGVKETTAPHLFFLDADCVPSQNWVATALSLAGTHDLIGGRVDVFHEGEPPLTGAQAFEAVFAFHIQSYIEEKQFTVTANLLTSRDIFEKTGPFRPGVSEDLDWCHRARDLGHPIVYEADLAVSHPSRNDWPALRKKWVRMTKEGFGLTENSLSGRIKWALRGVAMIFSIFVHLPKILFSNALATKGDKISAIGTLIQLRMARSVWMLRQALGFEIS